jgi:hypothetical protein
MHRLAKWQTGRIRHGYGPILAPLRCCAGIVIRNTHSILPYRPSAPRKLATGNRHPASKTLNRRGRPKIPHWSRKRTKSEDDLHAPTQLVHATEATNTQAGPCLPKSHCLQRAFYPMAHPSPRLFRPKAIPKGIRPKAIPKTIPPEGNPCQKAPMSPLL